MVPSLPRPPPSTASAPSLGAEQQGFGKDKCVSPPKVSRSIHTTAHGVSHVGSCSALGVARNTGVRGGVCVPVPKPPFPPAPGAGREDPWGDATLGDSRLAEPLHPGALHRPAQPQPRPPGAAAGPRGAQAVKPRGRSSPAHTYSCRGNIQPQDTAAPETRLLCFPSLLCHRHSWVPLVSAVPVPVSPTPGSLGPALGGTGRRLYCSQKCIVNEL